MSNTQPTSVTSAPNPAESLEARVGQNKWEFIIVNGTSHLLQIYDIEARNTAMRDANLVDTECTRAMVENYAVARPYEDTIWTFICSAEIPANGDLYGYLKGSFKLQILERDDQGNLTKRQLCRVGFKEPVSPGFLPFVYFGDENWPADFDHTAHFPDYEFRWESLNYEPPAATQGTVRIMITD